MKKLGISIYPEKSTFEADKAYLDLAHKYGFIRVFTSLLQIEEDAEGILKNFQKVVSYASSLGMEVMVDINLKLFAQLGVSYDDLSFFSEMGAYGIRLDMGFGGLEEKRMTLNPYGLKIEINSSMGGGYLDQIMTFLPNRDNLFTCHNFYPRRYTGLSYEHFVKCNQLVKKHGLESTAFVTSQVGKIGPWKVQDGLPTLEAHRYLDIASQVAFYKLIDDIDNIMVGNAYATEAELKAMADAFNAKLPSLLIEIEPAATEIERKILLGMPQTIRGDFSAYLMRSSMSRIIYKDEDIPAHAKTKQIKRGDILIDNNDYKQYKGEVFFALQDMENDGRTNVVGKIAAENLYLVDFINPWSTFSLVEKK